MCGGIPGSRYVPSNVGTRDGTGVDSSAVGLVGVFTGSGEPVGLGKGIGLVVTAGGAVGPEVAIGGGNSITLLISNLPPRTARRQKATNTTPAPA